MNKVDDGVKKVDDGVNKVDDGVHKVDDGVNKVDDGVKKVDDDAIDGGGYYGSNSHAYSNSQQFFKFSSLLLFSP